jgi:hypothetical protein
MEWEPTNSILAQPHARAHTGKNGEAEVGATGGVTTCGTGGGRKIQWMHLMSILDY